MSATSTKGFTIVELLVVIAVGAILMVILFGALNDLYYSNIRATAQMTQTRDARTALRTIEQDVTMAGAFYTSNTSDPIGPTSLGSKWDAAPYTYAGSSADNRVLIVGRYATTMSESGDDTDNPARKILMQDDCRTPIENVRIYYVKDETLYRRTVLNTAASRCAGQASETDSAKQTCLNGVGTAPCQGKDAVITTGVKKFSVEYYGDPNNDATKIAYPGVLDNATSVTVSIQLGGYAAGQEVTATSKLTMTRVNGANL